jgi:RHS repeat-associated protein
MTDSTGAVVWSADYKPFGEATVTVSTITNNLRFPGQYYDAETGLQQNRFRDYNFSVGRYIEKDPIGMWAGVNLYSYVGNKPLKYIDPFGLSSLTYNSGTGTITLYDGSGNQVGQYPAGNNTTTGRDIWGRCFYLCFPLDKRYRFQ